MMQLGLFGQPEAVAHHPANIPDIHRLPHMSDSVSKPAHYTYSDIEPVEVVEAWKLGYCLGSVIKYICRAEHKGSELRDLRKAQWHLARRIKQVERGEGT